MPPHRRRRWCRHLRNPLSPRRVELERAEGPSLLASGCADHHRDHLDSRTASLLTLEVVRLMRRSTPNRSHIVASCPWQYSRSRVHICRLTSWSGPWSGAHRSDAMPGPRRDTRSPGKQRAVAARLDRCRTGREHRQSCWQQRSSTSSVQERHRPADRGRRPPAARRQRTHHDVAHTEYDAVMQSIFAPSAAIEPQDDRLPGHAAQRERNPCPAGTMGS